MTKRLSSEATRALRDAKFDGGFAARGTGGMTLLLVERTRYTEAAQILAAAGLVLEDFDFEGPDSYLAAATITRAAGG